MRQSPWASLTSPPPLPATPPERPPAAPPASGTANNSRSPGVSRDKTQSNLDRHHVLHKSQSLNRVWRYGLVPNPVELTAPPLRGPASEKDLQAGSGAQYSWAENVPSRLGSIQRLFASGHSCRKKRSRHASRCYQPSGRPVATQS